jgi:isoleucyl-tRNA synthetase
LPGESIQNIATGLVHLSANYSKKDHQILAKHNISPLEKIIDGNFNFYTINGFKSLNEASELCLKLLEENNMLFEQAKVPGHIEVCWRCKNYVTCILV